MTHVLIGFVAGILFTLSIGFFAALAIAQKPHHRWHQFCAEFAYYRHDCRMAGIGCGCFALVVLVWLAI